MFRRMLMQAIKNLMRSLRFEVGKHLLAGAKERKFAADQHSHFIQKAK